MADGDDLFTTEYYTTLVLTVILLVFNIIANIRNMRGAKFTFVRRITYAFILCDLATISLQYTNA